MTRPNSDHYDQPKTESRLRALMKGTAKIMSTERELFKRLASVARANAADYETLAINQPQARERMEALAMREIMIALANEMAAEKLERDERRAAAEGGAVRP